MKWNKKTAAIQLTIHFLLYYTPADTADTDSDSEEEQVVKGKNEFENWKAKNAKQTKETFDWNIEKENKWKAPENSSIQSISLIFLLLTT